MFMQANELRHDRLYPKKPINTRNSTTFKKNQAATHNTSNSVDLRETSATNVKSESFSTLTFVSNATGLEEMEAKDDELTTELLETEGVFELVILGDSGVGKSSIVNRWVGRAFNSHETA